MRLSKDDSVPTGLVVAVSPLRWPSARGVAAAVRPLRDTFGSSGTDSKRVEQLANRPFEQLQGDVAGEAVGDDHVGCAAVQVAAHRVPGEVDAIVLSQQPVRHERQLVSFLVLLADREEAHLRPFDAEQLVASTKALLPV